MVLILASLPAWAEDSDALRRIVQTQCLPHMIDSGDPAPCARVDAAAGYAVLKDRDGATQYLLIPTVTTTGIEDPLLLQPAAPDYFAYAWAARSYTVAALGKPLPREDIGLAINSAHGRSQNQLHIHIDCLRADVRDALHDAAATITTGWSELPQPLAGHRYKARRVMGETLDGSDPFALLADGLPDARADMGRYTLAIAGETFADGKPGFILLADRANDLPNVLGGDHASSGQLLDHSCAVAKE